MDSACRNQQGNCDEVENSARPFLFFFSAVWLNLCNNSDQTLFSNALTFARSLGSCLKPRPSASVFNISLNKTMFDPYIKTVCRRALGLELAPETNFRYILRDLLESIMLIVVEHVCIVCYRNKEIQLCLTTGIKSKLRATLFMTYAKRLGSVK